MSERPPVLDSAPEAHPADPGGRPGSPDRLPAVAGLAAASAALGSGELTAAVFNPAASPLLSVGSLVIDLAPPGIKSAVIAVFGTGDKPFLIALLLIVVLVLGALTGLLQAVRPPLGLVVVAVLGVVGAGAAASRSGAGFFDAAPSIIGAVIGIAVLSRLVSRAALPGRRAFLVSAGVTAAIPAAAVTPAR